MKMQTPVWKIALLAAFASAALSVRADSVPEPGLVMNGIVRNTAGGNARMTAGALNWVITPLVVGTPIAVAVPLQNLNGTYSYRVAADVRRLTSNAACGMENAELKSKPRDLGCYIRGLKPESNACA